MIAGRPVMTSCIPVVVSPALPVDTRTAPAPPHCVGMSPPAPAGLAGKYQTKGCKIASEYAHFIASFTDTIAYKMYSSQICMMLDEE